MTASPTDHRPAQQCPAIRRCRTAIGATLTALAVATITLTGPAGGPAPAAAAGQLPSPAGHTVVGHGFGHGRGLSQYGARAAAAAGVDYRTILDFYYPGTQDSTWTRRIRVHIDDPSTHKALTVLADPGLRVRDTATGFTRKLPAGRRRWRITFNRATGHPVLAGRTATGWTRLRPRKWRGPVQFTNPGRIVRLVDATGIRDFRGALRAVVWAPGDADVVNVVPMDTYLDGVVPAEMPASWPAGALKAQAVAARTYAAAYALRQRAAHRAWDICDTTACQVYAGTRAEHPASSAAVAATSAQIRSYAGRPITAEFSSSNGGYMAAGPLPYQVAKPDPWDTTAANPYATWAVSVSPARLAQLWPAAGAGASISVVAADGLGTDGGRAAWVRITGAAGSVRVDAGTFRARLGLRSTFFTTAP